MDRRSFIRGVVVAASGAAVTFSQVTMIAERTEEEAKALTLDEPFLLVTIELLCNLGTLTPRTIHFHNVEMRKKGNDWIAPSLFLSATEWTVVNRVTLVLSDTTRVGVPLLPEKLYLAPNELCELQRLTLRVE